MPEPASSQSFIQLNSSQDNPFAYLAFLSEADGDESSPNPRLKPDFARELPGISRSMISHDTVKMYNEGVREVLVLVLVMV